MMYIQFCVEGREKIVDLKEMIGSRIQEIRNKKGITQDHLSEKVGITMANLSILKKGKAKAIRFSTLESFWNTLDCQPGDILEYVGNEESGGMHDEL